MSFPEVRSATFVSLVLTIVVMVFVNRSFSPSLDSVFSKPNPVLWWGLAMAVGALALMLSVDRLRGFLDLGPLHADDLAVSAAVAAVLLAALQVLKRAWSGRLHA